MATTREAENPEERRAVQIHCARVYLAEARRRRGTRMASTLLEWAGNARRRAAAIGKEAPAQKDLFA